MQVSRKYQGKLRELSKYCPKDFFGGNLRNALRDLMTDELIYGRLFVNGVETRDMSEDSLLMVEHFLKKSNVIETIHKHQSFST